MVIQNSRVKMFYKNTAQLKKRRQDNTVKILINFGSDKPSFRVRQRKQDTDKRCYMQSKTSTVKIQLIAFSLAALEQYLPGSLL